MVTWVLRIGPNRQHKWKYKGIYGCVSLADDGWPSTNVWTVTKWQWPYFLQCVLHRWHYFRPLADWKSISSCAEHTRQLAVDYSICNLFKSSVFSQGIGNVISQPSNSLPNCIQHVIFTILYQYTVWYLKCILVLYCCHNILVGVSVSWHRFRV